MPILFLVLLLNLIGFGITVPMLPFYAESFGASEWTVTLVIATYSASQMAGAPMWGRLADGWGRKPVIVSGVIGSVVAYVMLAYAQSLEWLFAARILDGFFTGNVVAAAAYVSDVTTEENRAKGLGMIGAAFGLAFIIGPATGAFLVGGDASNPDFRTPALTAAAISAVAAVTAIWRLRETLGHGATASATERMLHLRDLPGLFKLPTMTALAACLFLTVFGFASVESTFALWAERVYLWGPRQVGLLFAYAGVIAVIMQAGLIGPLTRLFGEARLVVIAACFLGTGIALIPFATVLWLLLVAFALLALGFGAVQPSLQSLVSKAAPPNRRGAALGLAQSASSLGRVFGPTWAGFLFQQAGRDWPYFSGSLVMLVMLMVALAILRRTAPRAEIA